MQERFHLAQCKQRRFLCGWFGEVHHHADVRSYIFATLVDALSLVLRHPRSALFALAWVEVSIEYCEILAILVKNLVGLDIRMIYGYILVFLEGDAVETCSQTEDSLDYVLQF